MGNDVVDLCDAAIADHHLRPRFVSRVCADDERARAGTREGLWTLFAAKEASYKALVKLGHAPGFGHRAIVVAPDLGSVTWRQCRLRLVVTCDGERVHAIAWRGGGGPPLAACERTGEPAEGAARSLLCSLYASATGTSASELAVVRDPVAGAWDGFGPPRLEHLGSSVNADVSLSHDGRFVAAALVVGAQADGGGLLEKDITRYWK